MADSPADRRQRRRARRGKERDPEESSSPFRQPRPERVAEEVEADAAVLAFAVGVLAVDQLGLLRVECQTAGSEATVDLLPEGACLAFAAAVADDVVGIPFERHAGPHPPQPQVERIVQEQVGQQRRDHPALRRSPGRGDEFAVVELHWRLQPALDVEPHPGAVGVLAG
jgi:hypothetical protein